MWATWGLGAWRVSCLYNRCFYISVTYQTQQFYFFILYPFSSFLFFFFFFFFSLFFFFFFFLFLLPVSPILPKYPFNHSIIILVFLDTIGSASRVSCLGLGAWRVNFHIFDAYQTHHFYPISNPPSLLFIQYLISFFLTQLRVLGFPCA